MALTKRAPNTIHLGGHMTPLGEWIGSETITPGDLLEFFDDSGKMKLRKHSGAAEMPRTIIALEKLLHNKGVDDTYAAGEIVYAAELHKGSTWWARVPSGQDIAAGDALQSNGNGMLRAADATTATAGVYAFQAENAIGLVAATTRVKAMVVR